MTAILSQENSLEQKTKALIDLANDKGGKDNITVVLIDYQSDEVDNIDNIEIIEKIEGRKQKAERKKRSVCFVMLIAVLALLIGAGGGWFAKNQYSTVIVKENEDVIFHIIDTLRIVDTLKNETGE